MVARLTPSTAAIWATVCCLESYISRARASLRCSWLWGAHRRVCGPGRRRGRRECVERLGELVERVVLERRVLGDGRDPRVAEQGTHALQRLRGSDRSGSETLIADTGYERLRGGRWTRPAVVSQNRSFPRRSPPERAHSQSLPLDLRRHRHVKAERVPIERCKAGPRGRPPHLMA